MGDSESMTRVSGMLGSHKSRHVDGCANTMPSWMPCDTRFCRKEKDEGGWLLHGYSK